jgi:hypothetical protein
MTDEIEITPEMIEVGNNVVARYWVELTTSDCALSLIPDMVLEVFESMAAVRAHSTN